MTSQFKTLFALTALSLAPLAGAAQADPHLNVQAALWGDGPSYDARPMAANGLRGPAGPVMEDPAAGVDGHARIQAVFYGDGPSYPSREALAAGLRGPSGPVMNDGHSVKSHHFMYEDVFVGD